MGEHRLERRPAARALARAELGPVNAAGEDLRPARAVVVNGEVAVAPVSDAADHDRADIESEAER